MLFCTQYRAHKETQIWIRLSWHHDWWSLAGITRLIMCFPHWFCNSPSTPQESLPFKVSQSWLLIFLWRTASLERGPSIIVCPNPRKETNLPPNIFSSPHLSSLYEISWRKSVAIWLKFILWNNLLKSLEHCLGEQFLSKSSWQSSGLGSGSSSISLVFRQG